MILKEKYFGNYGFLNHLLPRWKWKPWDNSLQCPQNSSSYATAQCVRDEGPGKEWNREIVIRTYFLKIFSKNK